MNRIPDRSKPVGLSLLADYSESFHHKAQLPQTSKIPSCLREFYDQKLPEEEIENQVKSEHEVKFSKPTVLQGNSVV